MTDSELKKIFDYLSKEELGLSEFEIAVGVMLAVKMAEQQEIEKARTVVSER